MTDIFQDYNCAHLPECIDNIYELIDHVGNTLSLIIYLLTTSFGSCYWYNSS